MADVLISKRKSEHWDPERTSCKDPEHTETQGARCVMLEGRDWRGAAASQGKPGVTSGKLGRGKEGFPCRCQREHGPADTLILDFQPPKP